MTQQSLTDLNSEDARTLVESFQTAMDRIRGQVRKIIVGQDEIIEHVFVCLLSRGHVLLIGVPGLAKTLLIRTLAEATDLKFSRIQFTPDLMPSDVTGVSVYRQGEGRFVFQPGPGKTFTCVNLDSRPRKRSARCRFAFRCRCGTGPFPKRGQRRC